MIDVKPILIEIKLRLNQHLIKHKSDPEDMIDVTGILMSTTGDYMRENNISKGSDRYKSIWSQILTIKDIITISERRMLDVILQSQKIVTKCKKYEETMDEYEKLIKIQKIVIKELEDKNQVSVDTDDDDFPF